MNFVNITGCFKRVKKTLMSENQIYVNENLSLNKTFHKIATKNFSSSVGSYKFCQ